MRKITDFSAASTDDCGADAVFDAGDFAVAVVDEGSGRCAQS